MPGVLLQSGCSRPFYSYLAEAVSDPDALFDAVACPYTHDVIGLGGFGLFVVAAGFVGLWNWSESYQVPLVWLAITAPTLAVSLLPGGALRYIAGIITAAFAMVFVGIWYWWGRG